MFGNGKGGVGKTSICANVAGMAAQSGWKVLAVDLDPQGNLGSDLGYKQAGRSDEGEGLLQAVVTSSPLQPLRAIRPNLDVICGGRSTTDLLAVLTNRRSVDPSAVGDIAKVLAPLSEQYDLLVIDSPPAGGVAVDAALAAASHLVIPVKFDEGSIDGLSSWRASLERYANPSTPTSNFSELCSLISQLKAKSFATKCENNSSANSETRRRS